MIFFETDGKMVGDPNANEKFVDGFYHLKRLK